MIPNDLVARLRLLTESTVNPVAAVHGITGELPELPVGQRFQARIEQILPDGTFRAVVADRHLTLALDESARPGDTLDLVVRARSPRLITAQRSGAELAGEVPPATLSRAGQLIGTLLADTERPAQAAILTRAEPLLPQPASQAALLAPALKQAIVESGLFYESHQAQWIAGRYPLEALRQEPQARQGRSLQNRAPAQAVQNTVATEASEGALPADLRSETSTPGSRPAELVPAELQPLVQQQLDAAATQHIVWRGEVWPTQFLQWEIEADSQQREEGAAAPGEQWSTRLKLTLPHLGEVDAVLVLTPEKVSLHMTATAPGSLVLKQGFGELATAFAAAGLPPLFAGAGSHEPA